ncbi:maleylacetate reductase [Sulfitobacter sp. TSTF-M16]|uniref:Maleylacetate reductase n=1 Tax=Sulfitobacter aestuariivivens TaxID=2766981 RepID=A0A927D5G4_9RHOB|nr:maleylacetate reductase [Sulfitobacter aestuariivivens]MBD3664169.1 maleylacetate reductase [Sulfitobacter aestuariivivens]
MSKSSNDQKVLFGAGIRRQVLNEVKSLGCSRALILSTPHQSSSALDIASLLNGASAGVFSRATMHTPVSVTDEAVKHANEVNADCVVAIGGGSTTGLGKAIAYRTDLPQIVIPTTYAGSEATPILGQTQDGVKKTLTDKKVLPEVILYDPELVTGLPRDMTVSSALNAMAHAAEALYAKDRNAHSTKLAQEGLAAFIHALPRVLEDPEDLSAREETLRGAWACGAVLGQVGMALHHKLCHTLGGTFDLPHAETHAIILPHAIHFNARTVADLLSPIADLLGGKSPGLELWKFSKKLGAPLALRDLGLRLEDLDHATELATKNPYWNPRELTPAGIRSLLEDAWHGNAPDK